MMAGSQSCYGQGSLRYFFFHGNHGDIPIQQEVTVEANIVVFTGQGRIVFGDNFKQHSDFYHFTGGVCNDVNSHDDNTIPARPLVERILKNVSVPTLVLAEVPNGQIGLELNLPDAFLYVAILVLGRNDLRPSIADDREYLVIMLQAFVPWVVTAMTPRSSGYLPGDARNLCTEIAAQLGCMDTDSQFHKFLELYRKRYVQKPLPQRAVIELCLLHVLKMPFELNTSIQSSLIRF